MVSSTGRLERPINSSTKRYRALIDSSMNSNNNFIACSPIDSNRAIHERPLVCEYWKDMSRQMIRRPVDLASP